MAAWSVRRFHLEHRRPDIPFGDREGGRNRLLELSPAQCTWRLIHVAQNVNRQHYDMGRLGRREYMYRIVCDVAFGLVASALVMAECAARATCFLWYLPSNAI